MSSKLLMFIAIISLHVSAEKSMQKDTAVNTKKSMGLFLEQMLGLKKYLISDDEFKDPKNKDAIETHLHQLSTAIKKTKHDPTLIRENFKFSRQVLEDHVVDTERVFRMGNKSYARWMINSTLNICMSCHTQSPNSNRHFNELLDPKNFKSDFDRAEFLFTVKDFEGANSIYQNLIKKYVDSSSSAENLETAVQRQVGYFARITRDFSGAQVTLKKFLTNKLLPEFIKMNLLAWIEQFRKWEKITIPNPSKSTAEQIVSFAEKKLLLDRPSSSLPASDPRLVSNLIVSGVLFEYLKLNPQSPKTPDILYWLAICDRETTHTFFYSMADLYLRECISQFPENAVAKKCYKEYEANTILGYTGSAGTNLPTDVIMDLRRLKDLVETAGKLKSKKVSP